jgi:hypothetical protein
VRSQLHKYITARERDWRHINSLKTGFTTKYYGPSTELQPFYL